MIRSEEMEFVTLYLSKDNARKCITELGNNEITHFKDLNDNVKSDKLLYTNELKHIEKLQSRLNFLGKEVENVELSEMKNSDLDTVEESINKYYNRMVQLKNIKKDTHSNLMKLKEDLHMVEDMERFVSDVSGDSSKISFEFITGIVDRKQKFLMKKILHQAFRRNLVVKTRDSDKHKKVIFIIFTHGKEAFDKIRMIFVSLGGRILDMEKYNEPKKNLLALTSVISRIESVEDHNKEAMKNEVEKISRLYLTLKYYIEKEYKIYRTLNKFNFDEGRDCLIGEAWIRKDDCFKLQKMSESSENSDWHFVFEKNSKVDETPPSSFKLNEYTEVFQDLINVYGVPSYREINPAIFMIFLFPMLFGVMFGDVFHGLILVFMSCFMIKHKESLYKKYKSFALLIDGRYVLFLCGLSSILFGFLYSDSTSFPIDIFGGRIRNRTTVDDIYPFGLDPDWHEAKNSMEFTNSVKMKMSIIIGFLHMGLGVVLSFLNAFHFSDYVDMYCVLIPQALAYATFLGYLVFLIVFKWLYIDLSLENPSLISTLVLMYTSPFTVKNPLYPGQAYVQLCIVLTLLIALPWMFFAKPIYLFKKKLVKGDDSLDVWMNSGIHTIEFGIGLISNSSSYLRLWAVSLAHAQLTKVLVEFTIGGNNSIFLKIFLSPIFILLTFGLLIGLEGLGACLHALRLNWIEFHSKFYKGTGYKFEPLTFKQTSEE
ncbi:V-type proton atpase subunit A (VPH1) [Vairimorpha necatrix]|uniref:V-type proton ATPase subunit a n=1 Tax=Vairimorpha necatrix TaxID=6039 RepID=A0AAX4JAR3_9MICR